ncbi:MAG: hypothetical protein ACJ735_04250 [Actinomycetes bacterium]
MTGMPTTELPPPPPQDTSIALVAVAGLLWPAPASVAIARRGDPVPAGHRVVREHLLVPDSSRPRLVTPAGVPRSAAAITARRHGSGGLLGRATAGAAAVVVRSGAADRFVHDRLRVTAPGDAASDDIEKTLSELLGARVVVGIHIGTARVNRKPVLHAVDARGRTLAFVKVGHTASARTLVQREAQSLQRLAAHSFDAMNVPTVLACSSWHGMDLLVLTALNGRSVRPALRNLPWAAMSELAALDGTRTERLSGSDLVTRLTALGNGLRTTSLAERYATALATLASSNADLLFGAWHGDWQPFNMAHAHSGRVAVWDWERFATGVPVGFDALHFLLQVALLRHNLTPKAHKEFRSRAAQVAIRAGVAAGSADVVVAAYVAEIAGRYVALAEGPDGNLLARHAHWTLALFESAVTRL